MKRNRQYISDKILQVRKDICRLVTEKMTVKQAYEKVGCTDISSNSFYQQCKALITLGYVEDCGYHRVGKVHSLMICSVKSDYDYDMHKKYMKPVDELELASTPRVIKLTDEKHWTREKKPTGRVFVSGSSLSMVMANY